jgi:fluoroacetyl-CoA thioesterase
MPPEPTRALEPGLRRETEFTVQAAQLTDVQGSLSRSVLATPELIRMLERTAAALAREHLPEGKATVGFEVCVRHVAAAREGARVVARVVLREVVDGRKLRFDVELVEGERRIGFGTHERRVIDSA